MLEIVDAAAEPGPLWLSRPRDEFEAHILRFCSVVSMCDLYVRLGGARVDEIRLWLCTISR